MKIFDEDKGWLRSPLWHPKGRFSPHGMLWEETAIAIPPALLGAELWGIRRFNRAANEGIRERAHQTVL